MKSKTVINPSANTSTPVPASCDASYTIENDILNIKLVFVFTPFDFRKYRWVLFNDVADDNRTGFMNNQKLNWIKCTIYNYIPFALCRAEQEGLYTNFNDATFSEIHWNLGNFVHNIGLTTLAESHLDTFVFEKELREKAEAMLDPSDSWFNTNQMGMTYNFSYGLNTNKFFSIMNPSTYRGSGEVLQDSYRYEGFDELLEDVYKDNPAAIDDTKMWKDDGGTCKAYLTMSIPLANDGDYRTYAVLYANPATRQIFTKFIPVTRTAPETNTKFVYVQNSLSVNGDDGKLDISIAQRDDTSLDMNIGKSTGSSNWTSIHPRITFKVKKITT